MIEEKTDASKKLDEAKAQKGGRKPTMRIKVYSPFQTYYEDDGYSISGINATGPFDILPHHHNFMTLLTPGELKIQTLTAPGEQKIRISGGLMHVKADKVTVFLDI